MAFDIHQPLANKHGEIDEDAAMKFEAKLMERFAGSPEARPIIKRTGSVGWTHFVMEYARSYEGVTVTSMTKSVLESVLLGIFPRKVSCEPSAAPEIVEELRAFFSFLRREFGLTNADECLALLDDQMARVMERELGDPRNFGMAKSIVMTGMAAGYDMTSLEGMNAFTRTLNERVLPALGVVPTLPPLGPLPLTRAERNKKKAQRKARRASRGKNR